ncbi:MAG: DNA mismatch repair endonuclease MutL [Candidatus Cloacimonetes bacterium]|nr:DNA mismatch repair endonuclease MutL [Candidatus Cloacimonadota bacterium]
MEKIQLMDAALASKVAAGEVITRPVNAVKELLENALDAGASKIKIEIMNGGKKLISVSDNGCGMGPKDLAMCIRSHATSKIVCLEDFSTLSSFGFRGEAIPSMGAVSKMSIESIGSDQEHGYKVWVNADFDQELELSALTSGTRVTIKELFYNIPARLKFLKSDNYEKTLIIDMVHSFLGVYPSVSFELIHNRERLLFSSGKGDNLETLSILFHRSQALEMFEVPQKKHPILGMSIQGYLSKPRVLRSSNKDLKIFVNNRIVKHPPILRAILVAYEKNIPDKKWPIGLFFIQIPPRMIDVNVHPMKLEIRIENEQILQEFITKNIRAALLSNDLAPKYAPKDTVVKPIGFFESKTLPKQDEHKIPEQEPLIKIKNVSSPTPEIVNEQKAPQDLNLGQYKISAKNVDFKPSTTSTPFSSNFESQKSSSQTQSKAFKQDQIVSKNQGHEEIHKTPFEKTLLEQKPQLEEVPLEVKIKQIDSIETNKQEQTTAIVKSGDSLAKLECEKSDLKFEDFELIGQLDLTFILGRYKNDFLMIDQHVAQERVLYEYYYEKLKSEATEAQQSLLVPASFEIPSRLQGVLAENIRVFENLGFRLSTEQDIVKITALPSKFKGEISKDFFVDLVSQIEMNFASNDLEDYYQNLAATMACKGSIKKGDPLKEIEMNSLMKRLFLCENPYHCPHGRPVIVKMPLKDIYKMFDRAFKDKA